MKICNSGHSIIVTAKWFGPFRPYITGCQLPGAYIFSQAHFHWGKNDSEGSEHTIDGIQQPLELHVMCFKTEYLTMEQAMKELDGIIVLAYLYQVRKQPNLSLLPVIEALPKVVQPNTSSRIELTSIGQLAPVFSNDFFSYWGGVTAQTNYKILWFINREAQTVSSQQLSLFRAVIGVNKEPLLSNFREIKSINGRTLFFVNPGKIRDRTLIDAPPDPVEKEETPPLKDIKGSKAKGKAKSAAPSGRRKSAKRKSSVRRKSRKESIKHTKTAVEQDSHQQCGHSSKMDESIHNVPRVLMTGVSFSIGDDCLSNSSCSSRVSSSSKSSINQDFDVEDFDKKCQFLLQENKAKEEIPFLDICSLMGKSNINAKCEKLLNKLNSASAHKKETCLPILNDLEKYIMETLEKVEKNALGDDELNDENLSANGEGTEVFNNGLKMLPPTVQDDIIGTNNKKVRTNVGPGEISNSIVKTVRQDEEPQFEWHLIQRYKCPERQFAEICSMPEVETREIFRVVINKDVEEQHSAVHQQSSIQQMSAVQQHSAIQQMSAIQQLSAVQQKSSSIQQQSAVKQQTALQAPSAQMLADMMRHKLQKETDSVDINHNLWNFPEMMTNNSRLTELLQQVTQSSGVKFITNETMAVVTSQSSTDDYNCSAEPSITQNVSYLAAQNTIMEIDQTKPPAGRFVGQKVEKLRKRKSIVGLGLDKGVKRQTIITKIFQNRNPNQRIIRKANINKSTTSESAAKSRPETSSSSLQVSKSSKKPVWKY